MNREFWEANAKSWAEAIQERLLESRKTTNPAIIDEILWWKPKSVLDLGCGEGWIGPVLNEKGVSYLGVDYSASLIDIARKSHPNAAFEVVEYDDLEKGRWSNAEAFDLIVFNFSLFSEEISGLLGAVAARLNAGGMILIQTLHPCFGMTPYEDGWKSEDFKGFPVPFSGSMPWYGRTLASWIDAFSVAGLNVRRIREPMGTNSSQPVSILFALSKN